MDESDRALTVVKVAAVGHREHDGGPVAHRVDLIDPRTSTTVASLAPDSAIVLAQALCEAAHAAMARAQLLPAQER